MKKICVYLSLHALNRFKERMNTDKSVDEILKELNEKFSICLLKKDSNYVDRQVLNIPILGGTFSLCTDRDHLGEENHYCAETFLTSFKTLNGKDVKVGYKLTKNADRKLIK
jgi:hypothetical protein